MRLMNSRSEIEIAVLREIAAVMARERNVRSLLETAIDIFERSEFMRELLGDHIFNYIVRAKRAECAEYLKTITQWEIDRYLPVL